MTELDIDFVREQFPVFQNPKTSNFAFFENAGVRMCQNRLLKS